jgi:hypothetical protein
MQRYILRLREELQVQRRFQKLCQQQNNILLSWKSSQLGKWGICQDKLRQMVSAMGIISIEK